MRATGEGRDGRGATATSAASIASPSNSACSTPAGTASDSSSTGVVSLRPAGMPLGPFIVFFR
ncbi:MAG TPA: hypothetical protein EYQ26_01200, partial [Rhodospirillales bacterium]|nr:hypothetical protein [Rhodospirillales bacterium]